MKKFFRAEVMSGSPRGSQLFKIMESGELAPVVRRILATFENLKPFEEKNNVYFKIFILELSKKIVADS